LVDIAYNVYYDVYLIVIFFYIINWNL
jgi:hypothetical protein